MISFHKSFLDPKTFLQQLKGVFYSTSLKSLTYVNTKSSLTFFRRKEYDGGGNFNLFLDCVLVGV